MLFTFCFIIFGVFGHNEHSQAPFSLLLMPSLRSKYRTYYTGCRNTRSKPQQSCDQRAEVPWWSCGHPVIKQSAKSMAPNQRPATVVHVEATVHKTNLPWARTGRRGWSAATSIGKYITHRQASMEAFPIWSSLFCSVLQSLTEVHNGSLVKICLLNIAPSTTQGPFRAFPQFKLTYNKQCTYTQIRC